MGFDWLMKSVEKMKGMPVEAHCFLGEALSYWCWVLGRRADISAYLEILSIIR